jgi:nitrate/TMAO reductase-like tetraheme cytochrome c subunit
VPPPGRNERPFRIVTGVSFTTAGTRVVESMAALRQTHESTLDTVVVESPLPGGAAVFVRFLLNTVPSWVQLGGIVVGAILGVLVLVMLVRRRGAIGAWVTAQSRAARIALAVVAVVLLAGVASAGAATWNYTQHSNDFCTGCHVMSPAFEQFSGTENKHAELSCHACHQQPLSASARQLYLWVAERPEGIGEHAPVDNRVCETCHATTDTAQWQRVVTTAGHRVHLESDSASLRDLQCVRCHGVEVHRFRPVAETCGQSGCHGTEDTEIVLGRMASQTMAHCASCHEFTAPVPALATRDSASGTLVPGRVQCMGCHEMRAVLAEFDEGRDPHGGKCGSCHDPHTQTTPAAASESCATCHADWRDEPFHVSANHRRVGERCLTCHLPHQAKVDASDCQACHESVRARGTLRPPLPFDSSAALRRSDTTAAMPVPTAAPVGPYHAAPAPSYRGGPFVPDPGDDAMPAVDAHFPRLAVADTFPHARHVTLSCLVCHRTGAGQGRLTFERPRGCDICHHQAPRQARCEACHSTDEYERPDPRTVTITVAGHPPRPRSVDFLHARHAERPCLECHTEPVSLALAPEKAQCTDCHAEHHAVGLSCSSCHPIAEPRLAHPTLESAHQRCDVCHTRATVEQLTPTRAFCSTCHASSHTNHYEPRECTVCHLLAEPAVYRSELVTPPPG